MPRSDGRIEPGQKLTSAISARAWNRAQDAADLVLGQRLGFMPGDVAGYTGRLVVPCEVSCDYEHEDIHVVPGFVVSIDNAGAKTVPDHTDSNDNRTATVSSLTGKVITPVSLDNYADAKVQLGVIVGGVTMPTPEQSQVVYVCIAGLCVARVRPRYAELNVSGTGEYKFLQGSVSRIGDLEENLVGAAEASSCGHHRIISYLGSATEHLAYAAVLL